MYTEEVKMQFRNYLDRQELYRHYNIFAFENYLYMCQNPMPGGYFDPATFAFFKGDMRLKINFWTANQSQDVTLIGEILFNPNINIYELKDSPTNIQHVGFCCPSTCTDADTYYKHYYLVLGRENKVQLISSFSSQNSTKVWAFRFLGWVLHFLSVVFIIYPAIFILSFIPFLGAIAAGILILAACLCSCATYLVTLVFAWIIARPVMAIILIVGIIAFIIGASMLFNTGKTSNQSTSTTRKRFF